MTGKTSVSWENAAGLVDLAVMRNCVAMRIRRDVSSAPTALLGATEATLLAQALMRLAQRLESTEALMLKSRRVRVNFKGTKRPSKK